MLLMETEEMLGQIQNENNYETKVRKYGFAQIGDEM